ncbi:MAG: heparinase II/III family protein [Clostridia bacterium]|nr:heparinase II/III family protein [Clostridia bacterium]
MELLGKGMDPKFWQEVREKDCYKFFRDELMAIWQKDCEKPIEALRYSDFRMFKFTGNRSIYEGQYFLRRRGMNASAMLALIYPEEEKYIVRLMDTIYAICDEYTWCLPAHQTALEVNNNIHLDLFACETGFALAEIYTLLGERLEPLIRDRIRVEYQRRVIDSFEKTHFGWEHGLANWNAVCTGSVACSMMLLHPELMEKYQPRFEENIEYYLRGFKDDGICEEGVGYWHYGFGFFTVYADMIRKFTNGALNYFTRPKVKEVATFMQKMYLSGKSTVSFSDGGTSSPYHLGLLHYLKNEYPDAISIPDPKIAYNADGCGRWCLHIRSLLWLKEEYLTPDEAIPEATYYAEHSQWMVHKNTKYGFAAKAGHNGEPHNQNDVGSFIIARDGRQVLVDPGAGAYTRQYFAADTRYDILQCSSRGHSVPIINGTYQHVSLRDHRYGAKDTKYENGVFSSDIAGAYPIPELKSLVRAFSWTDNAVILKDTYDYEGEGDIVERFVTLVEPKLEKPGVVTVDGVTVTYDPDRYQLTLGSEPLNANRPEYFIDLKLNEGIREFTATFSV